MVSYIGFSPGSKYTKISEIWWILVDTYWGEQGFYGLVEM